MFIEKYRPQSLNDMIGIDAFKEKIQKMISEKNIPHLLFCGSSGIGKTTLAKVLAKEILGENMNSNFHVFNASQDRGIDILREDITNICKAKPMGVPFRIVLMDEADYLTGDAQAAFRGLLEKYHYSVRFIFTVNYGAKLISPLHSRLSTFEFTRPDVKSLAMLLKKIGHKENDPKEDNVLVSLARKSGGDIRKAIGLLENSPEVKLLDELDKMTLKELSAMPLDQRLEWSFKFDPDLVFYSLWEKIKLEQRWDLLDLFSEQSSKANQTVFKQPFLSMFISKLK